MNGQVAIKGAPANTLGDLIEQHNDGEGLLITAQGDDLYVAFSSASFTIRPDGEAVKEEF